MKLGIQVGHLELIQPRRRFLGEEKDGGKKRPNNHVKRRAGIGRRREEEIEKEKMEVPSRGITGGQQTKRKEN